MRVALLTGASVQLSQWRLARELAKLGAPLRPLCLGRFASWSRRVDAAEPLGSNTKVCCLRCRRDARLSEVKSRPRAANKWDV